MILRTFAIFFFAIPLFAAYAGSGVFSPYFGAGLVPDAGTHVVGSTTYSYAYDFLGYTDPITLKPVLKTGASLSVADPGGIPSVGTEVEVKGSMQFDDFLSVVNPGPKIALFFDVSTLQAADPGFDWVRTRFSVLMTGYNSGNVSEWSKEQFFSITAPGATTASFVFSNLAGPGAPGIGGNDIPITVTAFALSIALQSEIGYSNFDGAIVATSASASVDAMHSLIVQSVQSLDADGNPLAGVSFGSAQGADYSATPEPGSFVLAGGAVLVLAALRRRSA